GAHRLAIWLEGVAPDAAGVVAEEVDRDARLLRDGAHGVNVAVWRQEDAEIARGDASPSLDRQLRPFRLASVVQAAVDDLLLLAAVESDEPPGQVVVNGCCLAWRHDQAEEAERAVAGAEEQPLADTAAHAALRVVGGVLIR